MLLSRLLPSWNVDLEGLMMSDKITLSLPYLILQVDHYKLLLNSISNVFYKSKKQLLSLKLLIGHLE